MLMMILKAHRIEAHGNGQVCQDGHKDIGSGRVAADIRDDHRHPSEDETGHPAREGGQVQPETSKWLKCQSINQCQSVMIDKARSAKHVS